jgi:beta-glucosidase
MKMNPYETEHADVVRRLAPECTVLLKKDGKFPLSSAGKIALYGSGARCTVKGGTGCGTTIKHFAVNNQEYNRTGSNSQVSERAMREIYLRGFEICVKESQPHALMTSYNLLNGTHTSERQDLIMDILRAEWGYQGIVMTDWVVAGMKQVQHPRYRNALSDRVAAAGGDLFMPGCKGDVKNIMNALEKGTLSRKQLKENDTRVYRMAKKLTEAKHD